MRGLIKDKEETFASHIIPYSTLKNKFTRGKVSFNIDEVYHFNRENILFITVKKYNSLSEKNITIFMS